MAAELTEQEMEKERRAQEIEKELFADPNEFMQWIREEFGHTAKAIAVHKLLTDHKPETAGTSLFVMWANACEAKSWEKAE